MLPQGQRQFLFAVRVGCVVVWPIFSTCKMKAFCIYYFQGNITFKNIINLILFVINLVEYLVINSYSVTVLDNFWKETSDRAKKHLFVFNSLPFILGNPSPPPWWRWFDQGITLTVWITTLFYHISTGRCALQLLRCCIALCIILKDISQSRVQPIHFLCCFLVQSAF